MPLNQEELEYLRNNFASIDRTDNEQLKKWIEDNWELSIADCAEVMGVNDNTILYYRRKFKLRRMIMTETFNGIIIIKWPTHAMPPKEKPNIDIPKDWKNPEWVRYQIEENGISMKMLARTIGCPYIVVQRLYRLSNSNLPKCIKQIVNE